MKWFKHHSDAHSNLKLQAVIAELGMPGYGFFWVCDELVAQQGEGFAIGAGKRWMSALAYTSRLSVSEIEKYLNFFAEVNLIDADALTRGDLHIPKLGDYGDEYSGRRKEVPTDSRQTPDNVVLDKNRIDKNKEEKVADALPPNFAEKIALKDPEYSALVQDLAAHDYLPAVKIHRIATDEFLPHWLERSEGAKKARWQKEKSFDYKLRFRTWISNYHKWQKDVRCKSDCWHRKGESCYCVKEEITDKTKPLVPSASEAVRALAASKRAGI